MTPTASVYDFIDKDVDASVSTSVSLGSTATFSTDFSNSYKKEINQTNERLGTLTVSTDKQTVKKEAITDYWNVVDAQLALEEAQKTLEEQQTLQESNQAQYDDGALDKLTLSESELAFLKAQQEVDSATTSLQAALNTMSKLIGKVITADQFEDFPSLQALQDEKSLYDLLPATSALQALQENITLDQLNYKSTKVQNTMPTLSASGTVKVSGTLYDASSSSSSSLSDSSSLTVSLSIPMDTYFKNSSTSITIENAKRTIDASSYTYQASLRDMQQTVSDYLTTIHLCLQSQNSLEKQLEILQYLEEQQKLSYESGVSDYSDYQDAIRDRQLGEISLRENALTYTLNLHYLACYLEVSINDILNGEN
jgi:outer membrane protein TolC